jgi:phage baseplate assembly protein V
MKPDRMRGLVIGIVAAVADNEKQGRVQVRFPWLDDQLQSTWASVVAPFAGDDRGVYWMPEVGDEVIVGFVHGDFSQAFILGATWNGMATAPSPDPRQRMIRSKNGHTIRFVDSTPANGNQGALIIEDAHGNRVIMTNSLMRITAPGTLMIEAQSIVLSGVPDNGTAPWVRTVIPSTNSI